MQNRNTTAMDGRSRTSVCFATSFNDVLFEKLGVDRFFYSVRPYYKPYRVGRHEYRGANV